MNKMPRKRIHRKLMAVELRNLHLPKLSSIGEIQHRAETVTPVLKAILDFRPTPHW